MNAIEKYFNGEKGESLVFIIIGVLALAMALLFYICTKN